MLHDRPVASLSMRLRAIKWRIGASAGRARGHNRWRARASLIVWTEWTHGSVARAPPARSPASTEIGLKCIFGRSVQSIQQTGLIKESS